MEAQNRGSKQDKVKSSFIEDWAGLTSQVRVRGAWATSSFDIVAWLTPEFKHQVFVQYGGIYPEIQWGNWSDERPLKAFEKGLGGQALVRDLEDLDEQRVAADDEGGSATEQCNSHYAATGNAPVKPAASLEELIDLLRSDRALKLLAVKELLLENVERLAGPDKRLGTLAVPAAERGRDEVGDTGRVVRESVGRGVREEPGRREVKKFSL